MHFHERRTLIQALCFSLAVHAVLLTGVVITYQPQAGVPAAAMNVVIQPKDSRPPISAAERAPRVAREVAPPSAPRAEARKAVTLSAKHANRRVEPEQPQVRIAVREPSPLVAPAATAAASASGGDAAPTAAVPVAPSAPVSVPAVGSAVPVGPAEVRAGVSADDLRRYRVALASAARRFKRYPALARATPKQNGSPLRPYLPIRAPAPTPDSA